MDSVKKIYNWYLKNKRELPFRNTQNPYYIWVSEIIMQQTRIEQGLPYYKKFIQTFPTVESLANATLEEVLLVWKGLGYYRRAIHIHEAANEIMYTYHGVFPKTYQEWLNLKGIGKYTAAAIASFAFGEKTPVVDGNVIRLFSRWMMLPYEKTSPILYNTIFTYLKVKMKTMEPGILNQSMMEYGALVCTPATPACINCIIRKDCKALKNNTVLQYPITNPKKSSPVLHYNYVFIKQGNYCLMCKRSADDIWKGLYEFPLIPADILLNVDTLQQTDLFIQWFGNVELHFLYQTKPVKHVLSHRIIYAQLFVFESRLKKKSSTFEWIPIDEIDKMPIPRLIEKLYNKISNSNVKK